jgi:hypothetical protein
MTKRDVAYVACKVLGLYFIAGAAITAVALLPALVGFFAALFSGSATGALAMLVPFWSPFAQLLIGILIWMRANPLADRIARDTT